MSATYPQATHPSSSGYGWTNDGWSPFWPGVNCIKCGRFVGRDGSISVEHFEMSFEVASVEGECARCLSRCASTEEEQR